MQLMLGALTPKTFLEQYWQKKPLLIRQGFKHFQDFLSAEEHAMAAEMMLSVKPDTEFSKEKLIWDREAISRFVERMAKRADGQRASGKITQIPVRRANNCTT